MDRLASFFEMGGYAVYVWPAYGIAVVVLAALVIASLRSLRARQDELRAIEAETPRRARVRGGPSDRTRPGEGSGSGDA